MKTLTTLIALIFAANLWGQTPELFNYQGIARDNLGVALISQNIGLELTIHSGSAAGPIVYQETHAVTTNQFGLFTTQVGSGTVVSGSMSGISWGTDIYFLEVSMDETGGTSYTAMGTTQLISVPYALHAETADNVTNDQVDDADADPTNELQDISLSGTDLSISNGSTVDMSSLQDGTGTDDQNLTFSGTNLTIEDGNTVDLSSLQDGTGTDDQNISGSGLSGTTLTIGIENGLSEAIDLAPLQDGTGTDDQNISGSGLSGTDLTIGIEGGTSETVDLSSLQDGTGTDDQNISGSGLSGTNLTIGIEGGTSETVDLSSLQDGTGTDDQNLTFSGTNLTIEDGNSVDLSSLQDGTGTDDQTLSLSGNTLSIEDGNSVDLSGLGGADNDWTVSGSDMYSAVSGNVGIGSSTPSSKLYVSGGNIRIGGDRFLCGYAESDSYTYDGKTMAAYGLGWYNDTWEAGGGTMWLGGYRGVKLFTGNSGYVAMAVRPSGNIGIGTTDPATMLELEKTNGGAVLSWDYPNNVRWRMGNPIGSTDLRIAESNDLMSNIHFTMKKTSGNVGFGTTAPTAKLSVNGTANKPGGGSWAVFSDERLKKNINPYTDGLNTLMLIQPKTFQYNGLAGIKDTDKVYVGIVAQEMQKIAPYTVREVEYNNEETGEEETYLEFDPSSLDFMIINAIQELNQKVDELQKENQELKKQLGL